MRIAAIIAGILTVVFGGSCLMWAGFADFVGKGLFGWLPIFVGGSLAVYAYRKDEQAPFPTAVKILVGAILLGIAGVAIMLVRLLTGPSIH